jgi:hypothetical protein
MKISRLVAVVAAAGLLVACENPNKVPAEAALKAAEAALASVKEEAAKYAPNQSKVVAEALDAAKAKLTAGEYKEALALAGDAAAKVKSLAAVVQAKKDELAKAWAEASGALPGMLAAVQAKIAELSAMKKLPKEIGADALAKAKEEAAGAAAAWEKAQAAFKGGALGEAVAQVRGLPEKVHGVMDQLGMHKH